MLTDEQAQELFKNEHCNISKELAGILARAIIAAVLPEGWVAVPKEPTLAMLDCLRADITSNLEKRYQAMLAAAPKAQAEKQEPFPFSADRVTYHKTAASPLDLMECLQDRPVEPSKAVQGKCVTQAEKQEPYKRGMTLQEYADAEYKQEPVKDGPVAFVHRNEAGQISMMASDGSSFDMSKFVGSSLYTHPQPDLMAEVEFMQGKYEEMLEEWLPQKQRIAELEAEVERLRQICRDAYEVWAGSDGIPEPITCVEAYMLQLLIAMRDEVKRGLK